MSFGTFFLYFVGAIILWNILDGFFTVILISLLRPRYSYRSNKPQYKYTQTVKKEFPDHEKGALAKKLGDLS